MKKILFIIHEASATGAPFVIDNLLKSSYFAKNECFVLSIYGGELENDLKNNAQLSILYKKAQRNFLKKVKHKFFFQNEYLKLLNNGFFDLVYINSVASLTRMPTLDFLKKNKCILHVHEGPVLIENLGAKDLLENEINKFSKLIFVSHFVKEALISKYEIDTSKFKVIPPVIRNLNYSESELNLLKFNKNSFVVCSTGSMNYIKGVDVFLQIAKNVINKADISRPIFFKWIGTKGSAEIRNHTLDDLMKMELEKNVEFLPNTDSIISYFIESDVFLLSSREESFSMVAMENAMLGNPVVCFDKGNGTKEFINNENGYIVPYMDINAASNAILEMYNDTELLKKKSEAIKKMSIQFSGDDTANQIFDLIDEVIDGK